jgi:hypothetical protein
MPGCPVACSTGAGDQSGVVAVEAGERLAELYRDLLGCSDAEHRAVTCGAGQLADLERGYRGVPVDAGQLGIAGSAIASHCCCAVP